jgi:hypothetical protein
VAASALAPRSPKPAARGSSACRAWPRRAPVVAQHLLPAVAGHLVEPARGMPASGRAARQSIPGTLGSAARRARGRSAALQHPPLASVDQRAIGQGRICHGERVPEAREHLGQLPGGSRKLRVAGGRCQCVSASARIAHRARGPSAFAPRHCLRFGAHLGAHHL